MSESDFWWVAALCAVFVLGIVSGEALSAQPDAICHGHKVTWFDTTPEGHSRLLHELRVYPDQSEIEIRLDPGFCQ